VNESLSDLSHGFRGFDNWLLWGESFYMVKPKYSTDSDRQRLIKIPDKLKDAIEGETKAVLHAGRDCMRNQGMDTSILAHDARNGYFGEAFGMFRTLHIQGYGYFGSSNLDAITEEKSHRRFGNVTSPEQNLNWWWNKLQREVLDEEGYLGDNRCEHCLEKYKKDAASLLAREVSDGMVETP